MQKVLILSHFFPPCNLTAAQRSWSWAQDLHHFGYLPIIVTRHWTSSPISLSVKHEVHPHYEVYYLPCQSSIKERWLSNSSNRALRLIGKSISFFELLIQNIGTTNLPYSQVLELADRLLSQHKDIRKLVVTANPFSYFGFGYVLNKKHNIEWIADYRDDWNTSEINRSGLLFLLLKKLESRNEKKWLASAACFTSVSPAYVVKIKAFIHRPGHVLLNGFNDMEIAKLEPQPAFPEFTIVYNGTLYETQPIELFISGMKLFWERNKDVPVKLYFLGLAANPEQTERIKRLLAGHLQQVTITERVNRKDAMRIQQKAALTLLVSHSNVKGIPSSKLYEYIGLQKAILLCPNDHDIIEDTLNQYAEGHICNAPEEVCSLVLSMAKNYNPQAIHRIDPDRAQKQFSRREQSKALASLLDQLNG